MNVKVAIVVLVLVAVLFLAVISTGRFSGTGDTGDGNEGIVGFLSNRVGDAADVPREQLHPDGNCGESVPDHFVFKGTCSVIVDKGKGLRVVRLLVHDPVQIETTAPPKDGDDDREIEVEADLKAGKKTAVAVGSRGGTFDLNCGFGATCRVDVERGG